MNTFLLSTVTSADIIYTITNTVSISIIISVCNHVFISGSIHDIVLIIVSVSVHVSVHIVLGHHGGVSVREGCSNIGARGPNVRDGDVDWVVLRGNPCQSSS